VGSTIHWLHLTDLHVGMDDQHWLWPRMRAKFRKDLTSIYPPAGWDLVLFTGDLVQKGTGYLELENIFDEIWSWFKDLGCDPKLLAVPGNHDLQWRDVTKSVMIVLEDWSNTPDIRNKFWNEPHGEYRQLVKSAFADYERWWRGTERKPNGVRHGLLPGDFSCTVTIGDLILGVVGLNSAFLQLTEKDDYQGRLALHPRQFHEACGGDGVKWAESHHACFLMTHHPPEWLDDESREYLNGEILESFCLHLCGHNHETDVLQRLSAGAKTAPLGWLGRSIFGLEKRDKGKLDRSHGYVAGELRVGSNKFKGQLQFTPRRREKQGDEWNLVPDHTVKLQKNDRTRSFPIPLRRVKQPPTPPPPPPSDAKELFRRVVGAITAVLEGNPALREQLDKALKSGSAEVRGMATDIIDIVFADGLYAVLTRFVEWLRRSEARDYGEELWALVEALSALGVPPQRIQTLRQNLESRRVDIATSSNPSIAAMIAAALLDVPMKWIENRHGLDPIPKLYVALSHDEVPYAGDETDSILFELKKRLIESPCLDLNIDPSHPQAGQQLEQRLNGLNALGSPILTILREDEAAMKVIEEDNSLDWHSLLVLRKKSDVDDVIPDALSVSTVLQGILVELRRIADFKPQRRNHA
jgi:hypothetical protein